MLSRDSGRARPADPVEPIGRAHVGLLRKLRGTDLPPARVPGRGMSNPIKEWTLGTVASETGVAIVLDIETEGGPSVGLVLDLDREQARQHARQVLAALGDGME